MWCKRLKVTHISPNRNKSKFSDGLQKQKGLSFTLRFITRAIMKNSINSFSGQSLWSFMTGQINPLHSHVVSEAQVGKAPAVTRSNMKQANNTSKKSEGPEAWITARPSFWKKEVISKGTTLNDSLLRIKLKVITPLLCSGRNLKSTWRPKSNHLAH